MAATPSTQEEARRGSPPSMTHFHGSRQAGTRERGRLRWITVGALACGLLAAGFLAAMPFIPAEPSELTGAVLCGFAVGWAMLGWLSARLTSQPQRWAWAPAAFMGSGGSMLLAFGSEAHHVLRWVWPPVMLALSAWMTMRIRRDVGTRFARWLVYPVVTLLAVASVAAGTETFQSATSEQPAMPGQLIDVGGHRLHLSCTGSGSPTVVLEPGAGMPSSTTGWIAPTVARDTRTCVYDRAGLGWSDPADTPQDATQIATDLHTLLKRANVPAPYVLAGHSFGGLYALTYAAQYPAEVAGMVLIDSTSPASAPSSGTPVAPPEDTYDPRRRLSALTSNVNEFGLMRFIASLDEPTLPLKSDAAMRASFATRAHLRSTIDEYLHAGASAKEAAALTTLTDKPLFVLTAGFGSSTGWMPKQVKLAALSTNSLHRVVDDAAHVDFLIDERAVAITSQAIRDVVASVRSGEPLASD